MAECIEREATIKRIKEVYCVGCNSYNGVRCRACGIGDAIDMIEDAPTVDAVPVVRCADCKHLCVWNRKDMYAFCPKTNIAFLPFEQDTRTFFCGFGERKDGGNADENRDPEN